MIIDRVGNCCAAVSAEFLQGRAALLIGLPLLLAMAACGTLPLPEMPTNQGYGYEGRDVVLRWDRSAHADSYTIYYSDSDSGCQLRSGRPVLPCKELTSGVRGVSYTHDFFTYPYPYDYWVVACNERGCSAIDAANPARRPPRIPDIVSVAQEGLSLKVTWNPVPEATHYKVFHNERNYCSPCPELDGNVVGTDYTHTLILIPDAPYGVQVIDRTSDALTIAWRVQMGRSQHFYWVTACNNTGCSPVADSLRSSSVAQPREIISEGVSARYYQIYRQPKGGESQQIRYTPEELLATLNHHQYIDEGLQPSAIYYYTVAACNDSGCSDSEAVAAGLTESDGPVDAPSTPTGFRGEKIDISGGTDQARVTWNAVEGATYFEVYQGSRLDAGISAPLQPYCMGKGGSGGCYQDRRPNSSLFAFRTTTYKVRACNKAGCSSFSGIVTVR